MFFSSGFPFETGAPSRPRGPVDNSKFYDLLGVDKSSSVADIKKAYRKLAIKHHPDKGGDQEKFKEISRAYEVLSDPEKRRTYDEYGEDGLEGSVGQDPTDIFDMFFGGGGGRRAGPRGKKRGEDVVSRVECTLSQLYKGASKKMAVHKSVICPECEGVGGPRDAQEDCSDCNGKGIRVVIRRMGPMISQSQSPCPTCQTTGRVMPASKKCQNCDGGGTVKERKVLEVAIDRGAPHGHRVVFSGEADEKPDEVPGDVVFILEQKEHPLFKRQGADLILEKDITLYEALTGVKFVVSHLDDRKLVISSKAGAVIKPGDVLGVKGEGMPFHRDPFNCGNLYVVFKIIFPEPSQLTAEAKEVFKMLLPTPAPLPAKVETDPSYEHHTLTELDMKESRSRAQRSATDEDADEDGGAPRVQCRQQ